MPTIIEIMGLEKPKGEPGESESEERSVLLAEDILGAIEDRDAEALAVALRAFGKVSATTEE